ncbi:MAG: hypothetical protein AB1749_11955 [Pseudomonadota bacterium]
MIKDTTRSDPVEIRALSDAEIEAVTGAGFWGDLWDGIKSAAGAAVDWATNHWETLLGLGLRFLR